MADALPTTALAQVFSLASSGALSSSVRIVRGGNYDATMVASGTKYFRTFLCGSSGGGTSATDPQEFLTQVAARFNAAVAGWVVRMRTDGRVEITNTAGSWSIAWATTASGVITRNLLGFTADVATTNASVYATATYLPTHFLATLGRVGDEGWKATRPSGAYEQLDDGSQYGWDSGYVRRERTFDLFAHPTDATAMTALASTITPLHAIKTRWKQPTATAATTLSPPWSVEDFVATSGGVRLGCALGTLQTLLATSTTEIDVATLDDKSRATLEVALIQPGYAYRRTIKGLRLHWYGTETR